MVRLRLRLRLMVLELEQIRSIKACDHDSMMIMTHQKDDQASGCVYRKRITTRVNSRIRMPIATVAP